MTDWRTSDIGLDTASFGSTTSFPFVLNLPKGRPFFSAVKKKEQCFDRLSTNGGEVNSPA
ncbi:hypothetical protein ASG11_11635 [Sphingomonas sp. Leaf357]|uniref:hypothetical protein n=1 Tax=Sphingomonas sp. Leaf357 TaxID=1736350 RepID=UPI000700718B|nr:hypothetical protein [Sphingomonas sp. Leaf357]KQS04821.1 hypothetical protein ASG11_11635 [Sphingomonas sp. Leaf357]